MNPKLVARWQKVSPEIREALIEDLKRQKQSAFYNAPSPEWVDAYNVIIEALQEAQG